MNEDSYFLQPEYQSLFQTNSWLTSWKQVWLPHIKNTSNLRYNDKLELSDSKTLLKKILPISSLAPFGSPNEGIESIYSEYWHFSSLSNNTDFKKWLNSALDSCQHQLVLPCVVINAITHQQALDAARNKNCLLLQRNPATAYSVNTSQGSFLDYIKQLSSNTRPKIFNRRKRLEKQGELTLQEWPDSNERFVDLLNGFHQERWNKPCFAGKNRDFIEHLLPQLEQEGHKLIKSVLYLDDKPISVLLDIQVGQRIYNLQAGYIENYIKGVALGTIHLGYQIEAAFNSPDIIAYDFMAGEGKNTNYKEKIANQQTKLADLLIIKPCWLKMLYKMNERRS